MTTSQIDLSGQVAVVTGSGRGIGRAHALALASRGAAVVVNDVDTHAAAEVTAEIEAASGRAVISKHDITGTVAGSELVRQAIETFGRLDLVIHNAGIGGGAPFDELTDSIFDAVFDVHVRGALNVCRPAWAVMRRQRYGRIVLTTSAAVLGLPEKAPYCVAKAGLLGLTRSLMHEAELLRPDADIRVNAIAPLAATRLGGTDLEVVFGTGTMAPESVAAVAVYLASKECALNGEFLHVGAGHVARLFLGLTSGWAGGADVRPEDIPAALADVHATDGWSDPESVTDVIASMAQVVLGDRAEAQHRVAQWLHASASGKPPKRPIDAERIN